MNQSAIEAPAIFNHANLAAHIGGELAVVGASPALNLRLTEIERSPIDGEEWEAFSMYLQGDPHRPLAQGTYRFAHPAFGEIDLFVSPKSEAQYEIAISRRRGE